MTHADAEFVIALGNTPLSLDGGGVYFVTGDLVEELAGPLGPRRCAPAEAMAGRVSRWAARSPKPMTFDWPAWWARAV